MQFHIKLRVGLLFLETVNDVLIPAAMRFFGAGTFCDWLGQHLVNLCLGPFFFGACDYTVR